MDNGVRRQGARLSWRPAIRAAKRLTRDLVSREAIPCRLTARLPMRISTLLFIHLSVDLRNRGDPSSPLGMLHIHDFRAGPVKVICDEGYLLVQLIEGVA
jgi:hypothetical protein